MDVKYMRKGRVEMDEIRNEVKLSVKKFTGRTPDKKA